MCESECPAHSGFYVWLSFPFPVMCWLVFPKGTTQKNGLPCSDAHWRQHTLFLQISRQRSDDDSDETYIFQIYWDASSVIESRVIRSVNIRHPHPCNPATTDQTTACIREAFRICTCLLDPKPSSGLLCIFSSKANGPPFCFSIDTQKCKHFAKWTPC